MRQKNIIAVLGGGGRTGKYVVNHLLAHGYNVKLLLRDPDKFDHQSLPLEIIKGDATDPNAIRSLIEGCHAVISTIGQRPGEPLVSSQATTNILKSMYDFGVRRYILIAGINVDASSDHKSPETIAATEWMKANFPEIHADRQKTYGILSSSKVDWTLVRVPFIEFKDSAGVVIIDLEDCRGSKISADAIAKFIVGQLSDHAFIGKSPFIAEA
jgi:putative NADH-flavin reductase